MIYTIWRKIKHACSDRVTDLTPETHYYYTREDTGNQRPVPGGATTRFRMLVPVRLYDDAARTRLPSMKGPYQFALIQKGRKPNRGRVTTLAQKAANPSKTVMPRRNGTV